MFNTVLALDINKPAILAYRENFPGVDARVGDVCGYPFKRGMATLVTGGFPCQPHSLAGHRKASSDERDCGPDFVEAVRIIQPRHFLGENVPGILTSENGRYAQRLIASMMDAGYAVEHKTLDCVNWGVAQFRSRVWFWGIRKDLYRDGMRHVWPDPTHAWPPPETCMFGAALLPGVTAGQALGLGLDDRLTERTERDITDEPSTTIGTAAGNQLPEVQDAEDWIKYRWTDKWLAKHPPMKEHEPAATITTHILRGNSDGLLARDATWKRKGDLWVRRLTVWECGRLQSLPDSYRWPEKFSKTNAYRCIGNGQSCLMTLALGEAIRAVDPECTTAASLFCGGGLGDMGFEGLAWRYEPSTETAGVA